MRSLILFGLSSLLVASVPVPQDRDGEQYTIAVDVDLVVFNVTVTDGKGRHVSGLKASDFQVHEDNRLQDIKLFNAEDVPASVGLVIDNSGSMRDKSADVAKAALAFADASNFQILSTIWNRSGGTLPGGFAASTRSDIFPAIPIVTAPFEK
jgi:hypothetical protein